MPWLFPFSNEDARAVKPEIQGWRDCMSSTHAEAGGFLSPGGGRGDSLRGRAGFENGDTAYIDRLTQKQYNTEEKILRFICRSLAEERMAVS